MRPSSLEIVMITGASAGVGRAAALEFARHGARIGLIARDKTRLETTRRDVERAGGEALVLPADVADPKQVEAAADELEEAFGPIDIWVNNAMVSVFSPVKEMQPEEYRRVMEVTYLGTVNGTLAALRRMLPRNQGRIVQVGSALAYRGIPLQSAYCAAKHAVEGFMDSLRTELLHDRSRVKVSMVQLPAVNTPQFLWVKSRLLRKAQPVPPVFQPEVAAHAIYWAAHHDRPELQVGWPTVLAVLADKLVPRLVDWYLARWGYEAQQTRELVKRQQPNNLWKPVPGNYAAHGPFDARSRNFSWELWVSINRQWLGWAALALGAGYIAGRKFAVPRRNALQRGLRIMAESLKPLALAWR